jgi:hypothetical protein
MNNCNCLNTCNFKIDYCNYPILCDDYDCANPETCVQMIPSDCVTYEGTLFEQYGLQSGVTVTEIIQKLVDLIYPNCNTITTTTTVLPQCKAYTVTNFSSETPVEYTYVNCSVQEVNPPPLNQGDSVDFCALEGSIFSINGNIIDNGICD